MKQLLLLTLTLVSLNLFAQFESAKQIFKADDMEKKISSHKLVAIIPFPTTISYKKPPKNFSAEQNKKDELDMAKSIQSSMYTFLLRRKDDYTVDIQDVEKTNILLKKAGMLDKLDEYTKDEIAKILGVDAIISGKFEMVHTRSEGSAIATTILFGGIGSKTGAGSLTMTVNDGKDGELLWRFFKTMDDNVFSSTDVLIERMMRKVSRNFPYFK